MSFAEFIKETDGQTLMHMTEKEKERAVNAWLTDPERKGLVFRALSEYLIEDHHLANVLLLSDEDCGRMLKNCVYAAIEADMQDAIDGLQ